MANAKKEGKHRDAKNAKSAKASKDKLSVKVTGKASGRILIHQPPGRSVQS